MTLWGGMNSQTQEYLTGGWYLSLPTKWVLHMWAARIVLESKVDRDQMWDPMIQQKFQGSTYTQPIIG